MRITASIQTGSVLIHHQGDETIYPLADGESPRPMIISYATKIARSLNRNIDVQVTHHAGDTWERVSPNGHIQRIRPPQDVIDTTPQVITITSPIGGSGVTTVTQHLGCLLGQRNTDQTLVINTVRHGPLGLLQDDPPHDASTILHAVQSLEPLRTIATRQPTHWYLDAHPDMTDAQIANVIRRARHDFATILVDTNHFPAIAALTTQLIICAHATPQAMRTLDAWIDHQHTTGHDALISTAIICMTATTWRQRSLLRLATHHFTDTVMDITAIPHHRAYTRDWRRPHLNHAWNNLANRIPTAQPT